MREITIDAFASAPLFSHLQHLSDARGLFEHARYATPRREHGYCVDDVARGIVVVCREPGPGRDLQHLVRVYLDFVLEAIEPDGTCHNRMTAHGVWADDAATDDWWGRAVWALGVAASRAETPGMRARALAGFRVTAQQRSPHLRSMSFAALGAAEILATHASERAAVDLLEDVLDIVGEAGSDPAWPWPEPRLTYANATVAHALLAAGRVLPDSLALSHGLRLLSFLLDLQTNLGHLSVTPATGWQPGERLPAFDQQPIEVSALADACACAYQLTRDQTWLKGITLCWAWFLGDNDSRTPMFDHTTGGGYDGLQAHGCNLNQGAESTLAMLSTVQHVRALSVLG